MADYWQIIVPEGRTNLITNSSAETNATGWTVGGTNTIARSSAQAKFGAYSLLSTYQDSVEMGYHAVTLTAAAYTFSLWVWVPTGTDGQLNVIFANFASMTGNATVTVDMTKVDQWQRVEVTGTPDAGDLVGVARFYATSAPTAGKFVYIDAAQVELASSATTYLDGDQPGCEWNGAKHASTSTRSAQSRAGGRVYDLNTQYGFRVSKAIGVGAAPHNLLHAEYEQLPGGKTSGTKVASRLFVLSGGLDATGHTALHDKRQALFSVLDPDKVPRTAAGPQPVLLRYTDATVTKEIAAHYEGGLEAQLGPANLERFSLRFLADDPFWYEVGQSAAILDSIDAAMMRYLAARLRSTGQWSALGLTANPTTGGTINAVLVASDGTVYFGGLFTGFDGNANWDYCVKYTPSTATWAPVGTAGDFGAAVAALAEGPDGVIYIGGTFTNAAGDASADGLAKYTPSTNTVAAVAAGSKTGVQTLAFDNNGLLYIGGLFVAWNAVNESQCIVTWNGTAYAAVANGFDSTVEAIAVAPDNTVYAIGDFTTDWNGTNPFVRFASWDGTTWTQCGAGLGAKGEALAMTYDGRAIVGGAFTNAGSIANADYVAEWNGTAFTAMGVGANSTVHALFAAPNNDIYASGVFTSIGGIATRLGRWNGSSWTATDIGLPGSPLVSSIAFSRSDPVIVHNFDMWIGFNTTGAASFAGSATVTNSGTAQVYPKIVFKRSGGTAVTIYSIRNETTGQELPFNLYKLLDGEMLTIDLAMSKKSVTSNFFGKRPDAILPGSDLGIWSLQPGANNITCYMTNTGGATVAVYLLWRDAYKAID